MKLVWRSLIPLLLYGAFLWFAVSGVPINPIHLVIFVLYCAFVFAAVWWQKDDPQNSSKQEKEMHRFYTWLLWGSFLFFLITRVWLFIRFGEAPLGYDTGFYLDSIRSGLSNLGGHRVARTLLWVPFIWMGFSPGVILHGLYLFVQGLLVGSVYMLAKAYTSKHALGFTALAVFLMAVSVPQFLAFWWMFYQMHLAIAFVLITLVLIHRRSPLAYATGFFAAAVHPATMLVVSVALGLFVLLRMFYTILRKQSVDLETILIGVGGLAGAYLAYQFAGEFIQVYFRETINEYGWFITNYPDHLRTQFTGLYIDFDVFRLANLYILPFAVLGGLLAIWNRLGESNAQIRVRYLMMGLLAIVALVMAYFPFIYQNRYLIILDYALIFLSLYPLYRFVQFHIRLSAGKVVIGLLMLGFIGYSGQLVLSQRPQVFPEELEELKAVALISEPTDYVMATESFYTPWVLGYSKRPTIDPGFLSVNQWTYPMWEEFWSGTDDVRRHELLQMYDRPIYLFVGGKVSPRKPYVKFIKTDPTFIQVSPHIWYYDNPKTHLP